MKKYILLLSIISVIGMYGYGLDFDPYMGPKPIIVLIETDPWLMVIGSDTPQLAIYENGLVIQKKVVDRKIRVLTTTLTNGKLIEITKKVNDLLNKKILEKYYDISREITDQPETKIYLSLNNRTVATIVYGLYQDKSKILGYTVDSTKKERDALPNEFVDVYNYLNQLKFDNLVDWMPEYFEVLIWDYSYAPDESIIWPKEWPDFKFK